MKSGNCLGNNQSRVTAPAGPYMRVSWFFRHDDVPGLLAAASRPGDTDRHVTGKLPRYRRASALRVSLGVKSEPLFDRDALGQVARLVDVPAQLGRHVIGQQLQRDVQQ